LSPHSISVQLFQLFTTCDYFNFAIKTLWQRASTGLHCLSHDHTTKNKKQDVCYLTMLSIARLTQCWW